MAKFRWYTAYDKLNASIYIIDAETYEILYANEQLEKMVGNVHGKKCYECLVGRHTPCENCLQASQVKDTSAFEVSKHRYNPKMDKHYDVHERFVDWDDGRKARLCIAIDVTVREAKVRHAEAMKKQYSIHQAILDSATIFFFAIDRDRRILYANDLLRDMMGADLLPGSEMPVLKLFGHLAKDIHSDIAQTFQTGASFHHMFKVEDKNGQTLIIRHYSSPVRDEAGNIFAYTAIGEDATEEITTQNRANWQHAIIENSKDFAASFDHNFVATYANPALVDLTGLRIEEKSDDIHYLTDASRITLRDVIIPTVRRNGFWHGEIDLNSKFGEPVPVNGDVFLMYDESNKPFAYAAIMRDARPQREADRMRDEAYRTQKFMADFSIPFTQAMDHDLMMDKALKQLRRYFASDRVAIYQYQGADLLTCSYEVCAASMHDDNRGKQVDAALFAPLKKALDNAAYIYQDDLLTDNALVPTCDDKATSACCLLLKTEGETFGYLMLYHYAPRSEWSSMDFQLAMMAASVIASAIAKRKTAQGLEHAMYEAQSANRAKSQFLSNMSHELRTPMNAIMGMAQLAKQTTDLNKINACMDTISVSSKQLLGIINDVLDISKIEAGKFTLNNAPFHFEKLIRDTCSLLMEKAAASGQRVQLTFGNGLQRCYLGDDLRIAQIVTNLMSNAVKFTPEGGSISVHADQIGTYGDKARLQIVFTDTGIGISPEQQKKIFDYFVQADGSITRRYGGTGLGLSICKNLVTHMDGSISVRSALGKGSTFTVELMLTPYTSSSDPKGEQDLNALGTTHTTPAAIDFSDIHLLLAEDIELNQMVFEAVLEHTGIQIDIAQNGKQALDMFRSNINKYDIVIMDVQMPQMNGLEATRAIRALDAAKAKSVPIIAMTANVFKEDVDACLAAGMNDHLPKPIDQQTVIALITTYVKR